MSHVPGIPDPVGKAGPPVTLAVAVPTGPVTKMTIVEVEGGGRNERAESDGEEDRDCDDEWDSAFDGTTRELVCDREGKFAVGVRDVVERKVDSGGKCEMNDEKKEVVVFTMVEREDVIWEVNPEGTKEILVVSILLETEEGTSLPEVPPAADESCANPTEGGLKRKTE